MKREIQVFYRESPTGGKNIAMISVDILIELLKQIGKKYTNVDVDAFVFSESIKVILENLSGLTVEDQAYVKENLVS